ncbi:tbc domain-containing [Cryptosporidium bovis]|uniref:tbc domain-containing n=1 Tax=Cryptosporidium bovis TaxID=310047 RepID=UPI003519E054|nr:tbc domain-containing [Cryptosporidium bovis]
MATNDNKNIVTLLAVNRAYNYFVPNFNNAIEMNYSNDSTNNTNKINSNMVNMNKFSFTKYLKIEKIKPHCNCDKDENGICLRMLNWLKMSKSSELGLDGIYNELISVIDFIIRMDNSRDNNNDSVHGDGDNIKALDKFEEGIINKLFNGRIVNSIYMDVCRTYPSILYFKEEGRNYLSKVLLIYSLIDIDVGYVQGMNFLVGCILWHSHSEELAFQLLVSLMFNYGMREMFILGLPGLRVKCKILDYLIQKKLFNIWDHIIKQGGTIDMLATDWFLTLFSYSIPLNIIGLFWDNFFEQGWIPLYKLILYRLQRIEDNILSCYDIADIMNSIKYSIPSSKNGIFGNAILNIKDELSKSNIGRFFNSMFSGENGETNNSSTQETGNNNSNVYSNDPNIISLPDVWLDLISEAQYEIEIDVDLIEELEFKFNSYYNLDVYNNNNKDKDKSHIYVESFEYYIGNSEIKEKKEQSEETPSRNNHNNEPTNTDKDDIISDSNLNSDIVNENDKNNITLVQEEKIKQIVKKQKQHYSDIINLIYNDNSYKVSPTILETKDKLASLFNKLLEKTEKMLIKSVKREHMKDISINIIEMQKYKFGPWTYQH